MYEIYIAGEVEYAETLDEVNSKIRQAHEEKEGIEVYDRETGKLIYFWYPDPDVLGDTTQF